MSSSAYNPNRFSLDVTSLHQDVDRYLDRADPREPYYPECGAGDCAENAYQPTAQDWAELQATIPTGGEIIRDRVILPDNLGGVTYQHPPQRGIDYVNYQLGPKPGIPVTDLFPPQVTNQQFQNQPTNVPANGAQPSATNFGKYQATPGTPPIAQVQAASAQSDKPFAQAPVALASPGAFSRFNPRPLYEYNWDSGSAYGGFEKPCNGGANGQPQKLYPMRLQHCHVGLAGRV